jgi:hypothetical protein
LPGTAPPLDRLFRHQDALIQTGASCELTGKLSSHSATASSSTALASLILADR